MLERRSFRRSLESNVPIIVVSKRPTPWYLNPSLWVGVSVLVGLSVGIAISRADLGQAKISKVLALPGKLWLKCIVLPMIIFSMVDAMVMLRELPGAKKVGIIVVALSATTTICAAIEGCLASVIIIHPAIEQGNSTIGQDGGHSQLNHHSAFDTILGIFDNLVPKNLISDGANMRLLPVIIASIIFGLLVKSKDEDGNKGRLLGLIDEINDVVMKVVTGIMTLTPFGVGSLVFGSAARLDLDKVGKDVCVLILSVVVGLLFHFCIVYPSLLLLLGGRNPLAYYKNMLPAFATALGTSSSAATLPVSTKCAIEKNGIKPYIANFILSLGSTMNMDGTSIYLICSCFFLGELNGIVFSSSDLVMMALLASICSMGSAPVPSASLVLLITIMTSVGVPDNETFGIISGVDWMLDRLRTTINVAGDAVVTGIVNSRCGEANNDVGIEMSVKTSSPRSSEDASTCI